MQLEKQNIFAAVVAGNGFAILLETAYGMGSFDFGDRRGTNLSSGD